MLTYLTVCYTDRPPPCADVPAGEKGGGRAPCSLIESATEKPRHPWLEEDRVWYNVCESECAAMKSTPAEKLEAGQLLSSEEPVVITHNGKAEGVYIPFTGSGVSREIRRQLFIQFSDAIREQLDKAGVTEEQILDEFEAARKARG